jgi:hypothetical protein
MRLTGRRCLMQEKEKRGKPKEETAESSREEESRPASKELTRGQMEKLRGKLQKKYH